MSSDLQKAFSQNKARTKTGSAFRQRESNVDRKYMGVKRNYNENGSQGSARRAAPSHYRSPADHLGFSDTEGRYSARSGPTRSGATRSGPVRKRFQSDRFQADRSPSNRFQSDRFQAPREDSRPERSYRNYSSGSNYSAEGGDDHGGRQSRGGVLSGLKKTIFEKRHAVGRGIGSGSGKTAGRGHKGQKARSGGNVNRFEGGQTPMFRRMPKRGFTSLAQKSNLREAITILKLEELLLNYQVEVLQSAKFDNFDVNDAFLLDLLKNNEATKVKIIGSSSLLKDIDWSNINLKVSSISAGAREALSNLGCKIIS